MKYVAPEMELVMFTNEEVIVASGTPVVSEDNMGGGDF